MKKFNSNSISRNNKYNGAGGAGGGGTASDIAYDNSLSGLVSQNVQQAIDELHDEIEIGIIYTTDEKKVGEWINGSPIYRSVLHCTKTDPVTVNEWYKTGIAATFISKLINGVGLAPSGAVVEFSFAVVDGELAVNSRRALGVENFDFIVEYTK